MARTFDSIIVGGDPDALVAAIRLAQRGSRVLLVEANAELGGAFREIEFAPGFRAAPLAHDVGHLSLDIIGLLGARPEAQPVSDPAVISLSHDAPLLLRSSIAETAAGLSAFSQYDSQNWPAFAERMTQLAGFLAELYRMPAPRIDFDTAKEVIGLAGLGRKFRALGRTGMIELLRTLPMALGDLLDDWFESDRLKGTLAALGVMDVCQGPIAGGTAYTLLHRHVGAAPGVFSERLRLVGGPATLVSMLADKARAAGVTIETNAAATRVIVREGRVAGLALASGEEIAARTVVSSLDPYRSLLELLDPVHLDPELMHAVRHIRFRGVATKILVALDALPPVPGVSAPPTGAVLIAPSVRHVERAYDATKYGRGSEEPFIEVRFPSVAEPRLAPAGKHVAVVHVQFTPYTLREGRWDRIREKIIADRAFAIIERHVPGFTARVSARAVLSPATLAARFGLREGALSQGELMLDQILFMRPVPQLSRYATPIPGYFLCGAGMHPGPGIVGQSGLLASRAALAG
ncbi:MAG TPA: NAD(P)/FAD-dependent oxidoreductase [Steroidobacteraceae bacterium]|jgi:phytoene dehydrogenase-like protein|nr:NAD(P)/FAD-dependent oxidoreductase [Steroidobacteraceae bacterium]